MQQAAVIPFRRGNRGVEVFLIRRRSSESWGIPKGMVDPGDTPEDTAHTEAWEEAGIHGRLIGKPIGVYGYRKWGMSLEVSVYVMEVREAEPRWPESYFREREWFPVKAAFALLDEHPVRPLLDRASLWQ